MRFLGTGEVHHGEAIVHKWAALLSEHYFRYRRYRRCHVPQSVQISIQIKALTLLGVPDPHSNLFQTHIGNPTSRSSSLQHVQHCNICPCHDWCSTTFEMKFTMVSKGYTSTKSALASTFPPC